MAIVKMNKFTLLAFESHKVRILKKIQSFQGVQFINLQEETLEDNYEKFKGLYKDNDDSKLSEYEDNVSKIKFSLEFLKPYVKAKGGVKSMLLEKDEVKLDKLYKLMNSSSWREIYKDLKGKEETLNNLENNITKLEGESSYLSKWIDFDGKLKDIGNFNYTVDYLGSVPKVHKEMLIKGFSEKFENGFLEIITEDSADVYFLALISKTSIEGANEFFKEFGFSAFQGVYENTPKEELIKLNDDIKIAHDNKLKIKEELTGYREKVKDLQYAYDYYNNKRIRLLATNNFLKTGKVVAICGWVAEESSKELEALIESVAPNEAYIEFEQVPEEEYDNVPIKLKNSSFSTNFESLVEMYGLPQYEEVDPTPILSVFYFIFFGMMLSDAGYGLVIMFATLYALKKTKDKEKRKSYKLFFFGGVSTLIWGIIYGGYFGDLPKYFGFTAPALLDSQNDIIKIFLLSLAFGIIHIFVGLGIKAYMLIKDGLIKDFIYDVVSIYAVIIGAILMLTGVSVTVGKVLLFGSIILLALTQGRGSKSIGGKIAGGINGVYGLTGYLGDVISYSRLLGLGLATGFICNALNLIVNLIPFWPRIILGPILFIALHTFNLLINALGSYVHSARLQYLEFFNKFYEGTGKKFKPYKLSDEYIKIKK